MSVSRLSGFTLLALLICSIEAFHFVLHSFLSLMIMTAMSPKVRLEPYLTLEELKHRYKQTKDRIEARRWHLLLLVAQKWTIKQASELVGLNYDYAKTIVRRYNSEGPESVRNRIKERQPPTPRSLLTPEQQQELKQALQGTAPDGGSWSGPKVAQWIAEKTGRDRVWAQRGWEYMQRFGSSR